MQMNDKLFTAVVLALLACVLALSEVLVRFDNLYYDLGRHLSFKSAPDDIVIIAIDEASIEAIGSWPWSKRFHTELINHLINEKPKAIGFDVAFSEPERDAVEVDYVFADAIRRAGNVVLPIFLEVPYVGAAIKQSLPIPMLASEAAGLGRLNVPLDADGVARSLYLWEGLSEDGLSAVGLPHFSQTVLQVANLLPAHMNIIPPIFQLTEPIMLNEAGHVTQRLVSSSQRKISFYGPPRHFNQISYVDVLANKYSSGFFKDKIVLVGVTALGLGDALPTPVAATSQPMSGIEFHANAIAAMQSSSLVVDAPCWIVSLLCALLAMPPLLWLSRLTALKSMLMIVIYFFVVILISLSIVHWWGVWVPASGALIAILLAYPVWSWRKLDSAQLSLDRELQRLRDELSALGMVTEDSVDGDNIDTLQSRILKVNLTAQHLRNLHKSRNDTLAFISHDIRAPLGAAMMLLDKFESNKYSERMSKMLTRAHNMAEGFLQASRAEMANVNRFHELDMVSLTQQALDDVYEISMAKQLKLHTDFPEECVWVRGDFGLLLRAVSNILLNAVKYSPERSVINVILKSDEHFVVLKVIDQGLGIPAKRITKVFKRFSRAEGEHQAQEGSGLGLYFVNVTVKKHRGSVSVHSEEGRGATFIVSLPLERRKSNSPVEDDRRKHHVSPFNDTI
ncbi:CHASE2 domain-containing protein [Methylotenera sp. L2L1]|uniref:CHASE2 domain-containing protein n=1 Tax=Methylotenera sp. L2L1 TaxID=1502770 RepID=UPI0005697E88|nr:CHASE2 domain-containing protein [Methylotenera sp. L2L1]